jgi:signal transduction histidine kinase
VKNKYLRQESLFPAGLLKVSCLVQNKNMNIKMVQPPLKPLNEISRLLALRSLNIPVSGHELNLEDITKLAAEVCKAPIAVISLVEENHQIFKAQVGTRLTGTSREISFCGHTILNPTVMVVEDATQDERFRENPLVKADPHIRFYAGAPLTTFDGFRIGTLCVMDHVPNRLAQSQTQALESLARLAVSDLERPLHASKGQERERFLSDIIKLLPVMVAYLDLDLQYQYFNPSYEEFFAQIKVVLSKDKQVFFRETINEPLFHFHVGEALKGHPSHFEVQLEPSSFHSDSFRYLKVHYLPDFDSNSKVCGVFEIISDLTELKSSELLALDQSNRLAEALKKSQTKDDELQAERQKSIQNSKLAALGELSAGVAHEINNPLAVISVSLQVFQRLPNPTEDFKNKLAKAQRSVERISKIVNGLKRFSRTGGAFKFEQKSLSAIVQSVLFMVEIKAKHEGVQLRTDAQVLGDILCDEIAIEQVLVNLINNGIDAVAGLAEKWVEVFVSEVGSEVILKVRDSGNGISPEIEAKLFNPFFTTKPVGQGTGLGLSVTRGILDQHQAEISIQRADKNTCFEVRFKKYEDKAL